MAATCWPTKNQELLLRACLLGGEEAFVAWREWQVIFEAEPLDEGSRRLLPLLYRNLQSQVLTRPSLEKLKQHYFHTWSQNQFRLSRVGSVIEQLNQAGIPNMLLKGSALTLLYYEDVGLRPMKDVDVLVPRGRAKQTMQLLKDRGWKSRYFSPEALIPFEQATEFVDAGNQNLDLHWRLMWEGRQGLDDDEFWEDSIAVELNHIPTRSLNAADQLLHVCIHGAKWNDTPSLRWIADAMMIIRSPKLKVDWSRLVRQANERQLTLPLRETLSYLHKHLNAAVPFEVLTELEGMRTTPVERWSYRARLGTNEPQKMLAVVWHWIVSLRVNCEGNLLQRWLQFSRYLQSLWSVTRAWQVPFYLIAKPVRRVFSKSV